MQDDANFWDCLEGLAPETEPAVVALVEAAFSSEEGALPDALENGQARTSGERPVVAPPPSMFLSSIEVQAFRGVGPSCRLDLPTGPGLTVVVGRNGSGKSSFAEALEVALTGRNSRWSRGARSGEMKAGWRNLHVDEAPAVTVELVGQVGPRGTLRMRWPVEAETVDAGCFEAQIRGQRIDDRDTLGWGSVLSVYNPILTYSGLGDLTDQRNSHLYDQLANTLGLDSLRDAQARLKHLSKALKADQKAARERWKALGPEVEASPDPRGVLVSAAMRRRPWDLDAVEAACDGVELGDEDAVLRSLLALQVPEVGALAGSAEELRSLLVRREGLRSTAAGRSNDLEGLLRCALAWHRGREEPCPVCGEGSLDAAWAGRTQQVLEQVRVDAGAARETRERLATAVRAARSRWTRVPACVTEAETWQLPTEAAERWAALVQGLLSEDVHTVARALEEAGPLLQALGELKEAATARIEKRDGAWRPLATAIRDWLPMARGAVAARDRLKRIGNAESVLKDFERTAMTERFGPIEQRAKEIWETLRQRSHVELTGVSLTGTHTSTRRGVELEVAVDGQANVALGVMSQGELHSLALSLFLPRLTHENSPFHFLVLDDPVQAMDPYKVDGLARVLEHAAQERQVVVFTHDARLPEALRRLRIESTVLRVERGAGSEVRVVTERDPVTAYLDEARALSLASERLGPKATRRVIPAFCRSALEAQFRASYRRRALAEGVSHLDVDAACQNVRTLVQFAALGIFGDVARASEVYAWVRRHGGDPEVIRQCKSGAHEGWDRMHGGRVEDTHGLVRILRRHL